MAPKRKREQTDGELAIERTIKELDRPGALAMLESLCEKWNLGPDGPGASFEDQTMRMCHTLGLKWDDNMMEDLEKDMGSFGLRALDESIRKCELEAIGLFHRMRTLGLFPLPGGEDPERASNLHRVSKVMETVFYAKRLVLSAFQAKLAVHQLHVPDGTLTLDEDLDVQLGAWALRFRYMDGQMTPLQSLLLYLLDTAMEKKYRKAGGWMWEPVVRDGVDTHAWRPVMEMKAFVHRSTPKETCWEQWKNATAGPKNVDGAVEYLTNCQDHQLPTLVKQRGVYSFANGVYLAEEDRFHAFVSDDPDRAPLPDTVTACKFVDQQFVPVDRWEDIPTPHLDSIANCQEWPDEVRHWLYIFLGRMLYAVNQHDGWQVVPFFKGRAGTGKSTLLLKVCKCFFEAVDVGILSNNIERKFGLSAFHDKYLVLAPEVRNDLSIEQGEFQSMVSGEDVQVNVKNQTAFSKQWDVPLGMAGNEVPGWADAQGSIQRRNTVFPFGKSVRNGDMKLGEKLEAELANIIQKCNKAYLEMARRGGDKNIWTLLPKFFHETRDALARATNVVEDFLHGPNVVVDKELLCPAQKFREALQEHITSNNLTKSRITDDALEAPLEKWGIAIETGVRSYRGAAPREGRWVVGCDIVDAGGIGNTLG